MPTPTARAPFSTASLLVAALAVGSGVFAGAASGQIVVQNLDDAGAGSLRQAVADATSGQTITFAAGLDGRIDLQSQIVVPTAVAIDGSSLDGSDRSIRIDGGNASRIFRVQAGSGNEVRLTRLTLQNGRAEGEDGEDGTGSGAGGGGGGAGNGGAVFADSGVLFLDRTLVLGSTAAGGNGGDGSAVGSGTSVGGAGGEGTGGGDGGDGSPTNTNGADGGFGAGGGGGGAGTSNGGSGGATAGRGADGRSDTGGGGGGGAAYGGGIFLADGARLIIAGDAERFGGNAVRDGQGGNPPDLLGATDGQDGIARGSDVAGLGTLAPQVRVDAGDTAVLNTDRFASIDPAGGLENLDLEFEKRGEGTLRLEGTGTGVDFVDIRMGTLDNATTAGLDNIFVTTDGAYTGRGDVVLLTNLGRVNPAGSRRVGTTRVSGNYEQSSGGDLDIEFGSAGVDKLAVGNSATLDGTVNFIELDRGVTTGTPLTFVEVDDSGSPLTGTFDDQTITLLDGSRILGATVAYEARSATVTFEGIVITDDFVEDQDFGNGRTVGRFLNDIAEGDSGTGLDQANLLPAFDAILGADDRERVVLSQANTTASAALAAVPGNQLLVSNIALARLNQGGAYFEGQRRRLASANAERMLAQVDPAGVEPLPATSLPPTPVYPADGSVTDVNTGFEPTRATLPEAAGVFAPLDGGPALFAQGLGAFSNVDGDDAAPGQDSSTYGVAFGGDWALEDWNAVAGVYVAFSTTETGVDGLGDEYDTDAFQVGLYGAKRFDEHLVVNAAGSAGFLGFDSSRPTPLGTAEGDADGFVVGGTVEALYDLPLGDRFIVSPLVGVEAFFVDRDGYTEDGAGALNLTVDDASGEYLTSVIGAQLTTAVAIDALGDLRLSPLVRLGWSHRFLDRGGETTSGFAVAPDETFTTRSSDRDRDALRVAAALELGPGGSDDWALFARYTGDIAANGDSHELRAGFRLAF